MAQHGRAPGARVFLVGAVLAAFAGASALQASGRSSDESRDVVGDRARSGSEASTPEAPGATASVPRAVADPALRPLRRVDAVTTRAAFPVHLDDVEQTLGLVAFTVLPGQSVRMGAAERPVSLRHQTGAARPSGNGWRWTAPEAPGIYALRLEDDGGAWVDFTALVLHPGSSVRGGSLNGYRIGQYRATPLRGDPAYLPPEGFVEVGRSAQDVLISPRLALGQFLCKQPGEPRYLAVSLPLVTKLEAIADHLETHGVDPSALTVMSGYRTPAYNRAIGNTTDYSRHLWGDAADIYIDADGNGDMDDLNGDGRVDVGDARVLSQWIEEVVSGAPVRPGGLAVYRRNAAHGPFVHVDARGAPARW